MALVTTALRQAGITTEGGLAAAVEGRAAIFEMTQAAEDAVLRPKDEGPWSHDLRAALAARIATLKRTLPRNMPTGQVRLPIWLTRKMTGQRRVWPRLWHSWTRSQLTRAMLRRLMFRACKRPGWRMPISCGWRN